MKKMRGTELLERPTVLRIYQGIGLLAVFNSRRLPANSGDARRLRPTICHELLARVIGVGIETGRREDQMNFSLRSEL